jgi:hypothetical protein
MMQLVVSVDILWFRDDKNKPEFPKLAPMTSAREPSEQ